MDEKLLVIRLSVNLKSNSLRLCGLIAGSYARFQIHVCAFATLRFCLIASGSHKCSAAFSTDELFDFSEILRK